MEIVAHRGLWQRPNQKNTVQSIRSAVENDFGVETDLREYHGRLVVSHDHPDENALDFVELVQALSHLPNFNKVAWALNIKEDGLYVMIAEIVDRFSLNNAFCFDMSVPDSLSYLMMGDRCRVFTRQSEYEPEPAFYQEADGVYLDEFNEHWVTNDLIRNHLERKKQVCIVSPELHSRERQPFWDELREFTDTRDGHVRMVTDLPWEAREFFRG